MRAFFSSCVVMSTSMDYLSKANISRNLGHRKRKFQTNKENDAGDCEKGGFLKAILYLIDCDTFPF